MLVEKEERCHRTWTTASAREITKYQEPQQKLESIDGCNCVQSVAHKTQAHVLINEPQQMILVLSEVGGKHNGYAGYYVCWKGQQLLFRFDFIYVDGFAFCIQRAIDLHVHAHELLCEFLVIEMVDMLPRG